MLREQSRLVARDQRFQTCQMIVVERLRGTNRQADTVERERVARPDRIEIAMRRAARAHVIFCVHLEEPHIGGAGENIPIVFGLETHAGAFWNFTPDTQPRFH